jgi:Helix-turn-helix domain
MQAGDMVAGFTAGDVGRALRRARTRQGLSVTDVSSRTGIPRSQLLAAETGELDLPDQLSTLRTVRRYADFLGLPGDRYALALLEHWPPASGHTPTWSPSTPPPAAVGVDRSPHGTPGASVPATWPTTIGPPTATLPSTGPDAVGSLRTVPLAAAGASTATEAPPGAASGADRFADVARGSGAYDDTGTTSAVVTPATDQVWRAPRRRIPLVVQALVGAVAVAVVVAVAALVVDHVRPDWLRSLGIGRSTSPPATTEAARARHTGSSTHPGSSTHAGSVVRPSPTSPSTATVTVGTTPFEVRVTAVGGESWVEVTEPTASSPLFAGILKAGQSHALTVDRSATVEVGSVAGRMSIVAASKTLLSTFEVPAAPYSVTFQSTASTTG